MNITPEQEKTLTDALLSHARILEIAINNAKHAGLDVRMGVTSDETGVSIKVEVYKIIARN